MRRVIEPLSEMGADIAATEPGTTAPLTIRGNRLKPIRYQLRVASAQVKSAILFAALRTSGRSTVIEPTVTRDHTERMLSYFLVRSQREELGRLAISIYGDRSPNLEISRCLGMSSAAFWLVAAGAQPMLICWYAKSV